jgi:hypothetical protein
MKQVARNATTADWEFLSSLGRRYLIHDRDAKFCDARSFGPAVAPALAERFVRSANECLGRFILFGERSLGHVLTQWAEFHYPHERNHQGKSNAILVPRAEDRIGARDGPIRCRKRLGGALRFYHREAA